MSYFIKSLTWNPVTPAVLNDHLSMVRDFQINEIDKCDYCGGNPGDGRNCVGCGAPVLKEKVSEVKE